jgi:hypothetical protein
VIQLTYNQATDLTQWWLDGYLDFDSNQKEVFHQDLMGVHHWHRTTQLPNYEQTVEFLDSKIQSDVSTDEICSLEPSIKARAHDLIVSFAPALTHYALSMKPEQLISLQKKYDKANKEWRRDWLDANTKDRVALSLKKDREIAQWLYSDLSDAQQKLLEQLVQDSPFDPKRSYEGRLRRQADSIETLKKLITERPSFDQAQLAIEQLLMRSTLEPSDLSYGEYSSRVYRAKCAAAVRFHNTTDEKQRKHAHRKLLKLEEDFTVLSKKTKS